MCLKRQVKKHKFSHQNNLLFANALAGFFYRLQRQAREKLGDTSKPVKGRTLDPLQKQAHSDELQNVIHRACQTSKFPVRAAQVYFSQESVPGSLCELIVNGLTEFSGKVARVVSVLLLNFENKGKGKI
jgi:hypothetical protein